MGQIKRNRNRQSYLLIINQSWFDILTLIGMRGDTLISLSFLDQILLAEFLSGEN